MKEVGPSISGLSRATGAIDSKRPTSQAKGMTDSTFLDQLAALQNVGPTAEGIKTASPEALALKFSNHAIDRMHSRGISFSPDQMAKIQSAVDKAASKGAKDTLLLTDDSALIVSIKDKTVVTVMDKAALKENVFTKIDSTVVI